jgi:hypothetical protein
MNIASFELCKELYKLSGWEDGTNTELYVSDKQGKYLATVNKESFPMDKMGKFIPAYDLGYLLRKLPAGVVIHKHASGYQMFDSYEHKTMSTAYDTPEDTACKLAIELFKQGVLKHD